MPFRFYRALFIVFMVFEIFLVTTQRLRYMGQRENAIVLILLATGMGLMAILASRKENDSIAQQAPRWETNLLRFVTLLGLGFCIFHFNREISVIPIDSHLSDIWPTIVVMNERLLHGAYPYQLITDFGYDLSPTYLPFMWLPSFPAALFHFDYRWVAFTLWAAGALALVWRAQKNGAGAASRGLLTALPFIYLILIEEGTDAVLGNTTEVMIAGFYLLFALQLNRLKDYFFQGNPAKKGLILAFFLSLCLLSRYSFLLWLPLGLIVLWFENRKLALYTGGWTLAIILVVFILPFLSIDPMAYINGMKYYSKAALAAWEQPGSSGPLYDGIGIAGIFRDEAGGDMANKLATLQRWQLISVLTVTALSGWFWWKNRQKIRYLPLFLLGSLKLYFAFFYGFIQMPYVYLMVMPCFFSLAVLMAFYERREDETLIQAAA